MSAMPQPRERVKAKTGRPKTLKPCWHCGKEYRGLREGLQPLEGLNGEYECVSTRMCEQRILAQSRTYNFPPRTDVDALGSLGSTSAHRLQSGSTLVAMRSYPQPYTIIGDGDGDGLGSVTSHTHPQPLVRGREIFRGYTVLPPAVAPDDWRTLLGDPPTLAHAEAYYRQAVKNVHPDQGGSESQMAALNAAIAAARKALK